jgi:hypothetical protein
MKLFVRLLNSALTLECLLSRWPNGGLIIAARAAWIAAWIFAFALTLVTWLPIDGDADVSWDVAKREVVDKIEWFAAIYAGVYAALYTRFSAQWSYLAGLYNDMMATVVANPSAIKSEPMVYWRAGFVEDAEDLHLAMKSNLASVIRSVLMIDGVPEAFVEHTHGGKSRLLRLIKRINRALGIRSDTDEVLAHVVRVLDAPKPQDASRDVAAPASAVAATDPAGGNPGE